MQKWWAVLLLVVAQAAWGGGLVPDGAIWKSQDIRPEYQPVTKMSEMGFNHLVGWINAATVESSLVGGKAATIEIREFKLLERKPSGEIQAVQTFNFGKADAAVLQGNLWNRKNTAGQNCWFQCDKAPPVSVAEIHSGLYRIDLHEAPHSVYHAWTGPRHPANSGSRYLIEVTLRVTGEARIQFGMDYWKGPSLDWSGFDKECKGVNNCEAWISDWFGPTKGFQTIRVPK